MDNTADTLWDWAHQFNGWLIENDQSINKLTFTALSVGFILLGIIKIITWIALYGSADRTGVGRSLKTQKIAEGFMSLAIGSLYGVALLTILTSYDLNFWQQAIIRLIAIVAVTIAWIFNIRFILAYRDEGWGRASTGIKQALRDAQQNDRDATQQIREDEWEARKGDV